MRSGDQDTRYEGGAAGIAHYMAYRETLIAASTANSIQCSATMQAAPSSRRDLAAHTVAWLQLRAALGRGGCGRNRHGTGHR